MKTLFRSSVTIGVLVLMFALPAAAQTPAERFRSEIERLLDLTGASAVGAQMATMVSDQVIDAMRKADPRMPERAATLIKDTLAQEFDRAFTATDGLKGVLIGIYAKYFTPDEVRALIDFYSTPIGRKIVSTLPAVMQESAAAGEAWAGQNMPRVTELLQQRLRSEGLLK